MADLEEATQEILKEFATEITEYIKQNSGVTQYNENVFEIREGDLLKQLLVKLAEQMSGDSSKIAAQRAAPINVLNKIVTKLSKLYMEPPVRLTENTQNQKLVDHYVSEGANVVWQDANEAFNSYKWTTIEIFEDPKLEKLRSRVVPSHLFLPRSTNRIDPLRVTEMIKAMGETTTKNDRGQDVTKQKYWVYTDDHFIPIDEDGDIVMSDALIDEKGEMSFTNDFGIIPFTYISKSRYLLIPIVDSDTIQMTLLIPVLLTDMNFGSMFLSMPILYGVDVDAQDMKLSPNNFWNLSTKENTQGGEAKPQIGVIKAEPDLEAQMNNAVEQFRLWVYTKDVRPGSVGKLNSDNFAAGIAKIIAEMDTVDNSTKQESYFKAAERDYWQRVGIMHNHLVDAGRIDRTLGKFVEPEKMIVNVEYSDVVVFQTREDKIREQKAEVDAGFTSKKRAISRINPDAKEGEIEEIMKEIDEERTVTIEVPDDDETPEI